MTTPETITITHTATYGKLTLTGTLTATPAQLQTATQNLAELGMKLKCDKCGDKHTSSRNTQPGDPCLIEDGQGNRVCADGRYMAVEK